MCRKNNDKTINTRLMKTRFKIVLLLSLATLSLNAQGIQIGYIHPDYVSKGSNNTSHTYLDGVQVGYTSHYDLQTPLSLQYGLLYSYLFSSDETLGVKSNTTAHNLDLPIHIRLTVPVISNINAFVSAGPNFSYAIANNTKISTSLGSSTYNMYGDNSNYNRFNIQLGLAGGLSYDKYSLTVGYNWGLLDLNQSSSTNLKINAFTIALGIEL